jgi:hypothetical protein
MGRPLQIADSGKPNHISSIPRWKPVLWFLVAIGLPLLIDSRNWHAATNLFELERETYSRYGHNSGKPIPTIRWLAFRYQLFVVEAPWKWMSHIFVLSRWKFFWQFKDRSPFKFSKKYPAAKHYTDIYRLVLLLTHLSFRWTVPLRD